MGVFRKTMSISTMGMINYRTSSERTAKYTRQTRNATRAQVAQNAAVLELQRQQLEAQNYGNVQQQLRPMAAPPGWYPDPGNPGWLRFFDPMQGGWTQHSRPAMPAMPPAPPAAPMAAPRPLLPGSQPGNRW